MISKIKFYIQYVWDRMTKPWMFKENEDDGVLGFGVGRIGKKLI